MRRSLALSLTALLAVPVVTVATVGTASADVSCTGSLGAVDVDDNLRVPDGAGCTLDGTRIDGNLLLGVGSSLTATGVTVGGNVQDENGRAGAVTLRSSQVVGNVQLEDGRGAITLSGNRVGGDVQPNANTGGVSITDNAIGGNLQCQSNSPAPTGSGNAVEGDAEGQCAALTGGSTTPPPPTATRSTSRLAGADRFATSAAISRESFPNGSATAYLARSDDPADALSASALPGGPVLVVPSCGTLPQAIAAEIRRLGATRVTALGGPGAVCDSILAQAAAA